MPNAITRRDLLAGAAALPVVLGTTAKAAAKASIMVGITVDTRPDWNGAQNFIRSIDEASSAGYRRIETFWNYVERWADNPQGRITRKWPRRSTNLAAGSRTWV
jgi:hypothetical protein